MDIEPNSTVTASNIAKAFQYKGSDIAYAVQVDGNILTGYDTKVAPTAAVTNKEVNALYANGALVATASGFSNPPAVVTVPYGKEVTFSVDNMESEEITPPTTPKTYKIKEQTEVAYDAYLTTSTPTTLANKGITINGKTMTISSTAAAAGAKNISLTVNYVKFDGTTAAAVDFTVNFEGTEVDPETPVSEVTYKAMDTPGKIIIDLGTALTGTPTDNAAMESINGWMKAELFSDFHITSTEGVAGQIDEYVKFFNEERPAYALEYLTPKQYREKYGF